MTKLTEDYIIEKKITGGFLALPGAIYMCMIIISNNFSRNRLANQGQTLCGALLERGNVNLVKWSHLHDQDGCHAHI